MDDLRQLQEKLTQYEQLTERLQSRIDELTDFVEDAAVPLHWEDRSGIILWANQAALDILGYNREEYVGRSIRDFHADPAIIEDMLMRIALDESLKNYPAQLRCKDGSIRHVLINSN